jgi:hypothetical protein
MNLFLPAVTDRQIERFLKKIKIGYSCLEYKNEIKYENL